MDVICVVEKKLNTLTTLMANNRTNSQRDGYGIRYCIQMKMRLAEHGLNSRAEVGRGLRETEDIVISNLDFWKKVY